MSATSLLLGLPGTIDSTKNLTATQARWLRWRLAGFDTLADLEAAVTAAWRKRQRERFLHQLAVVLAEQGREVPATAAKLPQRSCAHGPHPGTG